MTASSVDLLEFAFKLRSSELEVERRASTSRLYYAILHRAVDSLQPRGGMPTGSRSRGPRAVRDALRPLGDQGIRVERLFSDLHALRNRADYDVDIEDWTSVLVMQAERVAEEIAIELDRLGPPPGEPPFAPLLSARS